MNQIPPFIEVEDYSGEDFAERFKHYLEGLYQIYLRMVAFGNLMFRGLPVRCQFRPETFGKHYAFWHMMQEGEVEDDRSVDLERCRRVTWIHWVIQNAGLDDRIRVFRQAARGSNRSWVLWLHEQDYAVILWERDQFFMLKTAFLVKPHKRQEFKRDWDAYTKAKNG